MFHGCVCNLLVGKLRSRTKITSPRASGAWGCGCLFTSKQALSFFYSILIIKVIVFFFFFLPRTDRMYSLAKEEKKIQSPFYNLKNYLIFIWGHFLEFLSMSTMAF